MTTYMTVLGTMLLVFLAVFILAYWGIFAARAIAHVSRIKGVRSSAWGFVDFVEDEHAFLRSNMDRLSILQLLGFKR